MNFLVNVSGCVPVPGAVEFKMATGCNLLSLAASISCLHGHLFYLAKNR